MADQAPSAGSTRPDLLKDPDIIAKAEAAGQTPEDYLRDRPELANQPKPESAAISTPDAAPGAPGYSARASGAAPLASLVSAARSGQPLADVPASQATPPASFDAAMQKPQAGDPASKLAGPPSPPPGAAPEQAGASGHTPHAPEVGAQNAPGPVQAAAAEPPPATPPAAGAPPPTVKAAVAGAVGAAGAAGSKPAAGAAAAPPPAAPPVENPKELAGAINAFKATPGASEYKTELGRLADLQKTYQDAYKATLDKNEAKEIGERFGNALAQLGAGIQGQRTGYDTTTGLKFDKTDWAKRNEQALGELKAGLENLQSQQGAAERLEAEGRTQAGEAARQQVGIGAQKEAAKTEVGAKATAAGLEQGAAQKRVETEGQYGVKKSEILAGSRENVATTNAASRKSVQQIRSDTTMSKDQQDNALKKVLSDNTNAIRTAQNDARTTKGGEAAGTALGQYNAGLGLMAQGKVKEANVLLDKPGVRGTAMQALGADRYNSFLKDAQDAAPGLFGGGGDISKQQNEVNALTPKGQPAAAPAGAAAPAPGGAKVHMKDPRTGQEADVNPEAVDKYLKMGMQRVGG